MRRIQAAGVLLALAMAASAPAYAAAAPAKAPNTVEIEMMTWPELKAAIAAGKTTALFYTGGTEQRGPQNIIAGHNFIGRQVVKHIAEKLGNAIALPVLPFSPANGNAEIPGDIGIPPAVLGPVLEAVSEQAIANGFKTVVLMGDSGGGQGPDGVYADVAKKLSTKYAGKARVLYADHPYTAARDAFNKILVERKLPVGQHGGIQDTSEMMYLETIAGNGEWVRKDQLPNSEGAPVVDGKVQRGPNTPNNGVTGDARKSSVELGKLRHEMKVDFAVKQIQALIAAK
ncbi:MAG: creatininase family protein [Rhodospirillaceae bacterium]|nr:creatininase family protein [Rhodospirillaceae bacterium]